MSQTRTNAKMVKLLRAAEAYANEHEFVLDNGAEVGSLVGSIADELETKKKAQP